MVRVSPIVTNAVSIDSKPPASGKEKKTQNLKGKQVISLHRSLYLGLTNDVFKKLKKAKKKNK